MYTIDSSNAKEHSYPVYGRRFKTHRWYKPIIVGLLFAVIYVLLSVAMEFGALIGASGGSFPTSLQSIPSEIFNDSYDQMDLANTWQSVVTLGGIALMIPSLWIAALIVRDRPFSSYSSARGGWNHKLFWRVFPIAFVCISVPILVDELFVHHHISDFDMDYTLASFAVVTVLAPLQCIAEEYIFRGLLMQTLGSWTRVPVIAVILQSALFALAHPYNNIGKMAIFVSGTVFALSAWLGRGIEVSSAYHICNNLTIFYLQGMNMTTITSTVTVRDLVFDAITGVVFVVIIFIVSRKTEWFSRVKRDDAAAWNQKYDEKIARKEAKKAAKAEKIAAKNAPIGTHEESAPGKHFKQ